MIRELEMVDAQPMFETLNDKNVNQYMNIGSSTITLNDCKNFILNSRDKSKNIHFAITDNNLWVGTISLKNIDNVVGQAEYAIITSSKIHGKGIAFVATMELLDFAFSKMKLNRIYLNVLTDNERANHFYIKCGFKLEGTFRMSTCVKGNIVDLNWYSILREEYLKENKDVWKKVKK